VARVPICRDFISQKSKPSTSTIVNATHVPPKKKPSLTSTVTAIFEESQEIPSPMVTCLPVQGAQGLGVSMHKPVAKNPTVPHSQPQPMMSPRSTNKPQISTKVTKVFVPPLGLEALSSPKGQFLKQQPQPLHNQPKMQPMP